MEAPWRPRCLTVAQLEQRRRAGARLFRRVRAGSMSLAEVARGIGVSRQSAQRWFVRWGEGGVRALRAGRRTGRPARLSREQWGELKGLIVRGARAAGFPTEAWTLRRIARVIRREFGVCYHFRYLERPLRAHGITPQVPRVQAREREEALVRAFLEHDWPALKKRLAASGAAWPSWTRRVTRFGPA